MNAENLMSMYNRQKKRLNLQPFFISDCGLMIIDCSAQGLTIACLH